MRIQPRQRILDVWRSMMSACLDDGGQWIWGGRDGSNSVSDAEQLLCLLSPSMEIASFALDRPDDIADDIRETLQLLGDGAKVGRFIIDVLGDYLDRYTGPDDQPIFAAGSYLRPNQSAGPTESQQQIEVVDSYSMSLTLCIAALGFLQTFGRYVDSQRRMDRMEVSERIRVLSAALSKRLTAAMVGMVRSFVVSTVEPSSVVGRAMLAMLNQTDAPREMVVDGVRRQLERVRSRLRYDDAIGTPGVDLDDDELMFECGWTWGIARDSAKVPLEETVGIASQPGFAEPRPYLYFTLTALDGINNLASARTRELDLLNDDQRRLTDALQIRWEMALQYWSTIAQYGDGNWPLQDIPWRTSDGAESEYHSLIVTAVLIQELIRRGAKDFENTKIVGVLETLADRGRINSRATGNDVAASLHVPGVLLNLLGSSRTGGEPELVWVVSDYAAVLLGRALQAARLSGDSQIRGRLMTLAESAMDHLDSRTIQEGSAAGLWDRPDRIFGETDRADRHAPDWYMTKRIVECFIIAYTTFSEPPLRTQTMVDKAVELLNEADHVLNKELLDVSDYDGPNRTALTSIEQRLSRARSLVEKQPGTAKSLAYAALQQLDELAYARQDAKRSS